MSKFGKPLFRLKCGEYADVSGYLGPTRMIGFFIDMLHNGNNLYALVIWKWYVGIHKE